MQAAVTKTHWKVWWCRATEDPRGCGTPAVTRRKAMVLLDEELDLAPHDLSARIRLIHSRRRLRGKRSAVAFDTPGQATTAMSEKPAFESVLIQSGHRQLPIGAPDVVPRAAQDLLKALGVEDEPKVPQATEPAVPKEEKVTADPPLPALQPTTGMKVRIKGLVSDSDLNEKLGRLGDFNASNERQSLSCSLLR
eukprot:s4038_g1.t1